MTELDPNQIPPEPNAQDTDTEGDQPVDATTTPAGTDGPPVDDDQVDLETVSSEATETTCDDAIETASNDATETASDEITEELATGALTVNDEATVEPEAEVPDSTPPAPPPPPRRTHAAVSDDTSDVASIPDEPTEDPRSPSSKLRAGDWQAEMSAHRIAVELKRMETRIRELLSDRDSRRKRKLAGTYRWHELEEDIIGWRAERRLDRDTIEELHRLACRRHFLFNQLRFAAATRPTWNS